MTEPKVALITGASRGIGKTIAVSLASAGLITVVNYLEHDGLARDVVDDIVAQGGTGSAAKADVSSLAAVKHMVGDILSRWGRIDVLVNNAGIVRDRSFKKMTQEDWSAVIDVNLHGTRNLCATVLPAMLEQRYGRIVNIASVVGQAGNFGQANYAASKAGIIGLTRVLALECAASNVTVNAICPGFIATEMWSSIPPEKQAAIVAKIPMGQVGRPEDVAAAVRFLVFEASYITGHSLNVNGGMHLS